MLDFPRSTIYAGRARALNKVTPLAPVRRGPKPKVPDHERLAAVRADLTRTPFVGEGACKVWARLRIQDDIRVSRARVLRLMRENGLLSPHRQPQKPPNAHDG
ncbi:MAG: transposase [Burkholderia sp.]